MTYLYYNPVNIGDKIKSVRLKKKMSVIDLSKHVSVSETAIYKIESGTIKNPGISIVSEIAAALGISVDELIK